MTASIPSAEAELPPIRWKRPLVLFLLTVVCVLWAGAEYSASDDHPLRLLDGASFAVPLLAILLTHEFAHFTFARIHRVNASLPYFIPVPAAVSYFGTMGAVIVMRDRIKSRNALLDIGASGPIAGMIVAIPVLLYGLAHSEVKPLMEHGAQEGQCLLYWAMKRAVLGPIPAGSDVYLSATAFAGWVGLLVTMLNLLPVGQLDGGHVAYALFGARQNRYARFLRWSLLALLPINVAVHLDPAAWKSSPLAAVGQAAAGGAPWAMWFVLLTLLGRFGGGVNHPPTEPGDLSPGRRIVAIASLVMFVLLFMPTPWMTY